MTTTSFYTFYTKDGWLTPYGLSCGYIESHEQNEVKTTLWREGGVYHVRQHDHHKKQRVFWASFELLKDARRRYRTEIV